MTKTIKDPNQMVEIEIIKMLEILKNGSTNEQKKKARKEIIRLEKHLRDTQTEYLNGKKFPVREVPPKVSKKELLELIDSVDKSNYDLNRSEEAYDKNVINKRLDLSGVSPGLNRFVYKD